MRYLHNNRYITWLLFILVIIVPLLGWLQLYQWQPVFTPRSIFPLLGIWAWSIMWTHYIVGAIELRYPGTIAKNKYGQISAWFVLGLLLLHPGLLGYVQQQELGLVGNEGFVAYVGASSEIFVTYGIIALLIFLSYEIFMRIRHHERIQKYWGFVSVSQMIAMVLIFVHGLGVGQSLQIPWIRGYWIFLGVLLMPAFYIIGKHDWKKPAREQGSNPTKTT